MATGFAITGVAIVYFIMDLYQVLRVPSQEDYAKASLVVRERWEDGDVLIFSPAWAHEGAPFFDGLEVRLGEITDWYELTKRTRVWVVGSLGHREPSPPPAWQKLDRIPLGKVTVTLWRPLGRGKLVYDFRERIGSAEVRRVHRDRTEICLTYSAGRWYCGAIHQWQFVGRHSVDVGGLVRDVIWAHPMDKGIVTEISYTDVPRDGTLVIHWGMTQRALDSENPGLPVVFNVTVDGKHVLSDVLGLEDGDWNEFETSIPIGEGPAAVVFSVSTLDNRDRQFVFTADVWKDDVAAQDVL